MELHILIGLNVCSQPVVPGFLCADMMLRYFIKQFQDMFVKALSVCALLSSTYICAYSVTLSTLNY